MLKKCPIIGTGPSKIGPFYKKGLKYPHRLISQSNLRIPYPIGEKVSKAGKRVRSILVATVRNPPKPTNLTAIYAEDLGQTQAGPEA